MEPSLQDRVGEEVTYLGGKWRIVADDSHSRPRVKIWDYLLKNIEDGSVIKVLAKQLDQTA